MRRQAMTYLPDVSGRDHAHDRGYGSDPARGARLGVGSDVLWAGPCAQNKKQAAARPCADVCKLSRLVAGNKGGP
jgi:hypothetical protein